ncbi:MAG: tetratricopeptide repeat protein [Gammaproteobacteria bacterium]|nr:MAG: tetratricopeptide repeat protein [Gammaproteobacteria bacterium]
MIAVSQRYLGRIPAALATLARLEELHPAFSRLFQERGHCYVALRSAGPAISAFERAVSINAALPASWSALKVLYRMAGRLSDVDKAAAHVATLAELPAEIVTAFSMFSDGEIFAAETLVRQFLLTHGDHIEGMRLLAKIGMELDVVDDAELLLENVLVLAPDYHAARYEYAVALLKRHKHVRAKEELEKLLKIDPDNRVYRTTHATVCTGFGDYEQALPHYRELLLEAPQDAELHLSIAHALKTLGRPQEAIESYRAAAAARPRYGEAYWSLANLKTYRFTDDELARMRADEAAPAIRLADRYHMCFALGKALEDRGQYAESFGYYERGNALKKTECRYKPGPIERNARLQAAVCTREFFAAREGYGCDSAAPIFIVGLPRAGSTLIEQILASHSQVEGTMELADIPRLVQDLQGRETNAGDPRYPGVLAELTAEDCKRLGEKYLQDTRVYRTGKPHFIDKMPNNFRHLGLIQLMLPNARIIDARREPMACCFSNFKQLFASGQQFTYSIEDIARYYRSYLELMAHWDDALAGKVLRVQHEDVVDNLEANVRRILDFCGLEFEPDCLQFHKTQRAVHSASSEQVRQPIYKEGLDQWRNFEPWLGSLKEALGELARP